MNTELLEISESLQLPKNYYSGIRRDTNLLIPDRILCFSRHGIWPKFRPAGNAHSRYLLNITLGISCAMILEGDYIALPTNSAILIFPWQQHFFVHNNDAISRFMVTFQLPSDSAIKNLRNKIISFTPDIESNLLELIVAYKKEDESNLCSLLLAQIIQRMLYLTAPHIAALPPREHPPILITKMLKYLGENMGNSISIDEMAEGFNISASHLRFIFRREMGISIGQYLDGLRMGFAMTELATGSMRIGAIAQKCGYNSSSVFIHAFRRYTGLSPLRYRQKPGEKISQG
jgi:AraC-like DNA-binding protein